MHNENNKVFLHKIKVIEDILLSGILDEDEELKKKYLYHLDILYHICNENKVAA